MYCSAAAVLRIFSACKQGKNYHSCVYVKNFMYTDAKTQQCNVLSDSDDDDENISIYNRRHEQVHRRM